MNLAKQQWAHMRRARIAGARVERVSFKAILARDGYHCHICDRPVAEDELSFDHLQPIAAGGAHSMENIKVAHLRCNLRKSGPHKGVQPLPATAPVCRDCRVELDSWTRERCASCVLLRERTVHGPRYRSKNRAVLVAKQRAREIADPTIHSKSKAAALMTAGQHARRIASYARYRAAHRDERNADRRARRIITATRGK